MFMGNLELPDFKLTSQKNYLKWILSSIFRAAILYQRLHILGIFWQFGYYLTATDTPWQPNDSQTENSEYQQKYRADLFQLLHTFSNGRGTHLPIESMVVKTFQKTFLHFWTSNAIFQYESSEWKSLNRPAERAGVTSATCAWGPFHLTLGCTRCTLECTWKDRHFSVKQSWHRYTQ